MEREFLKLGDSVDEYKEQIIKLIAIGEAQLRTIRLITGFPDLVLSPQIEALKEAKSFMAKRGVNIEVEEVE